MYFVNVFFLFSIYSTYIHVPCIPLFLHTCVLHRLIVVLLVEIHIFFFSTSPEHTSPSPPSPHHLCTLSTSPNPRGLCEVCSSVECQIMAYPATQRGAVLIKVRVQKTVKKINRICSIICIYMCMYALSTCTPGCCN